MSSLRLAFALLVPLLLSAACTSPEPGTGGAGGTGGSGAAGGASARCPVEEPEVFSLCFLPEDVSCTYGACCGTSFQCINGKWLDFASGCAPPEDCPASPPDEGQGCDACFQVSPCTYDLCGSGEGVITATCADDAWHRTAASCPDPGPCSEVGCPSGEVCVETSSGIDVSFHCEKDPCAPMPLSCDCAAPLCGGDPFVCSIAGDDVICDCTMCP